MADQPSDLVQGTLDMLILKTLALESTDGNVRLERVSKGVFRLNALSLPCWSTASSRVCYTVRRRAIR
jgi:PadR family transcriptional regulator, regulatory protein PadR